MSAQNLNGISGLVAINSLMAMVGGVIFAVVATKCDPGFAHNGALAGLIAICAGSDLVHPLAAFLIGGLGALIFVYGFQWEQEKIKIDDVLGVWPLHGMIGTWGGISTGIFGDKSLGGLGGVSFMSQLAGSLLAIAYALATGFLVYSMIVKVFGFRISEEDEFRGSDLSIHNITAYPEEKVT
jgi:Amt family ammonium transporter